MASLSTSRKWDEKYQMKSVEEWIEEEKSLLNPTRVKKNGFLALSKLTLELLPYFTRFVDDPFLEEGAKGKRDGMGWGCLNVWSSRTFMDY